MRNIPSSIYDRIEHNNKNQFYKIGYYDAEKNSFVEVARFRNSYNKSSGANYGLLQVWSVTFDWAGYETQGGYNTCGGYNKPIANLESILYNFKKAIENHEIITDCGPFACGAFDFSSCGSVTSLLGELKGYLQKQYTVSLFLMDCNG